jgi:putative ABC transport system permease protein
MRRTHTRSPSLAVWLLTRRLADEWRDFVLGDLEEEFLTRSAGSPLAARAWFWRQAIRCLVAPPPVRRRRPLNPIVDVPTGDSTMRTVFADLRYAVRVLLRMPSFSAAVICVLALGIGANAAIFSIVNAVLLRPLPLDEPERVVRLFHTPPQNAFPGITRFSLSPANFYDWQRASQSFDGMAMYRLRLFALTGSGTARSVLAGAIGAGFFDVVRARPALGRDFRPEEDTQGGGRVVILSDRFWKSEFGSARDVISRTMTLDGETYTIVGVMPPTVSVAAWNVLARDFWVPMALSDDDRAVRENHNQQAVARLKPGVDLARAQADLDVISARLEREFPKENAGWGAEVIPLQELIVGDVRTSLVMLLGAVALVLLIACANVGNLLFTRTLARRKEIAIRSALGAGRGRVFQQLLIEALVLASIGGALGLAIAAVSLDAAATLLENQVPRAQEISIDVRVLMFAVGASILTGVLAGVLPALRAGRSDLTVALKEGGRGDGAIGVRTRRALIVCEVALSVVLLMAAGVMLQSLLALRSNNAGFDADGVLTMAVSLPAARYPDASKRKVFFDDALQRIRALPGVESAATIDDLPLEGGSVQPIVLEGQAELLPRDQPTVQVREVTPGYFRTMRIPLLRGRDVADSDGEVVLVSAGAAKLLWGNEDPIGRRVTLPLMSRMISREVIGIVGDVKQGDLTEPPAPTVYRSRDMAQRQFGFAKFVIKTAVPPNTVVSPATAAIRAVDPEQPIQNVRTLVEMRDELLTSQRFSALLLAIFASVALVLATVGIYSVLSYIVRGRSREIGIRTALGAGTADVLRLVIFEGMTPTLIGIAAGAAAALASATLLERLVFGISASDPLTLGGVSAVLAFVALLASLVPAYRAARLDPLNVLRAD